MINPPLLILFQEKNWRVIMNSNPKKEKVAAKVKTGIFNRKKFLGPNSVHGKIKGGKYEKPAIGPPDATYQISQQPFHINLEILGKDGQVVKGDLVIKYKIVDVEKYFGSLYDWDNSIKKLESELGYEINAELAGYGINHSSNEIMTDYTELWAEIQNNNGITFREMGIRPYKTFVKWNSKNPVVDFTIEQIIEDSITEKNGALKQEVIEKGEYLEQRLKEYEEKMDMAIKESVNGIKTGMNELGKKVLEYGSNLAGKQSDIEKSSHQTQALAEGFSSLKSEVISLNERLNEFGTIKEELNLLKKNKPSNQKISSYLHDKSIAFTMSNPSKYNAGSKGPEFIDEFIKEGTVFYERLTDPQIIFGDDILKAIAERAYKKVYGDKK